MLIVRSRDHRAHHCLELDGAALIESWESPDRADRVDAALDQADIGSDLEPVEPDLALIETVHTPDYLHFLRHAWSDWVAAGNVASSAMAFGWPARRFRDVRPDHIEARLGYYSFAADCSITAHTWRAVLGSAAAADTAATAVAQGALSAFARCRPPGHHASRDQFGGYCYLNNAAVAAQRLRDEGASRVAVLDVDYHHGNGTQDIFYERADVVFCSVHADPREEFPYFLGLADEHGSGDGEGSNLNLPLPRGSDASVWFSTLKSAIEWIGAAGPDALVVSLGVDTFEHDPISHFRLTTADFSLVGDHIAALACPTVFVMEGGYATDALGRNVVGVLRGYLEH